LYAWGEVPGKKHKTNQPKIEYIDNSEIFSKNVVASSRQITDVSVAGCHALVVLRLTRTHARARAHISNF
jgi:hypothetical protein